MVLHAPHPEALGMPHPRLTFSCQNLTPGGGFRFLIFLVKKFQLKQTMKEEGRRKNRKGRKREEEIAWVKQLRSPIEALGKRGLTSQARYNLYSPHGR